jgi:hypothetical protein
MLDAMPFLSCNFKNDPILLQKYAEKFTNESATDYLSQYPNHYKAYLIAIKHFDVIKDIQKIREKLLNHVCYVHHLIGLVDYYKKLSFKTRDLELEYGDSVEMFSTVINILANCQ